MADEKKKRNLPHIVVTDPGKVFPFRNPRGGGGAVAYPPRDPKSHVRQLMRQLDEAIQSAQPVQQGLPVEGYHLTIRSAPGFQLPLERLESDREDGPRLLFARDEGEVTVVHLFVPHGGLGILEKKIRKFADKKTKKGEPSNAALVANMESIRLTALHEMWDEAAEPFPEDDVRVAWEAWLRNASQQLENRFLEACRARGLVFGRRPLRFPDRVVVLLYATARELAQSLEIIDCLAALRRARLDTAEFTHLDATDQSAWADDVLRRLQAPGPDAPVVCLLDTGVNNGHPLLEPILPGENTFAYKDEWGKADHDGHGTMMAGLAGYGDLLSTMASTSPVAMDHGLESVKILPPHGSNPPEMYGSITIDACAQPELVAPERARVFSMAVTTTDGRSDGRPSTWSTALDQLASGYFDQRRRLLCVAAGNAEPNSYKDFPDGLVKQRALDPAQAWNVLTVGASTEKTAITERDYSGYQAIAPVGDLSPTTSTSIEFDEKLWPPKPDVVLEGGNVARDLSGMYPPYDELHSLRLLTTDAEISARLLTTANATSAATSQAAHMAAQLMAGYPDFWPETIRGLVVHSARWTPAMTQRFGAQPRRLVRACGHGIPSFDRARWSASNALTLVVQSELHPYRRDEETNKPRAGEMRLFRLPWPRETLDELHAADVRLRVTLSYFVEPNPVPRGFKGKYSYASHQFRFEMQRRLELPERFAARVNKLLRDESYAGAGEGNAGWALGDGRNIGSCISDVWQGSAAELARREHIAVFPVGGWWKNTKDPWQRTARFALVVSIETDEEAVDIYTPVAIQVGVPIETDAD